MKMHNDAIKSALQASGMDGVDMIEERLNDFLTNYLFISNQVLMPRDLTSEMEKFARSHHEGEPYLPHSLYEAFVESAPNSRFKLVSNSADPGPIKI